MLRRRIGILGRKRFKSSRMSSPLFPGMLMSRMTTSQSCRRTCSSVSCAVLASAKVTLENASARVSLSPRRNTAWSSAIKTFIVILSSRDRTGEWDRQCQGSSGAGRTFNFEISIEQESAFLHSNETERSARFGFGGIKTAAIVDNLKNNSIVLNFQECLDPRGVSVARHIGQRLLKDSEDGSRSIRVEMERFLGQCHTATNPRSALKFLSVRFKCG